MAIVERIIGVIISAFAVFILRGFLDIFCARKQRNYKSILSWSLYFIWFIISSWMNTLSGYLNIFIVMLLTLLVCFSSYEGSVWKKVIFSISFNVMAMLLETICGYAFMIVEIDYKLLRTVGSFITKSELFLLVVILKLAFQKVAMNEIPRKNSLQLMFVPIGSIYVITTLFLYCGEGTTNRALTNCLISSLIMLGINFVVYFVYSEFAKETEIRRLNTVYKQQMELYDRHMAEKATTMLTFRDVQHDIKQKLFVLVEMAKEGKNGEILSYLQGLIDINGTQELGIARSGNSIIDSLINYKYTWAKKEKIQFEIDLKIPLKLEFSSSDICVILGNAIDNAIEAAVKVREKERNIRIAVHYIQNNLSIVVINTYNSEELRKGTGGELLTTKKDFLNHGIGLQSIKKAVEKYEGTMLIDCRQREFVLKMLLYGQRDNYK